MIVYMFPRWIAKF